MWVMSSPAIIIITLLHAPSNPHRHPRPRPRYPNIQMNGLLASWFSCLSCCSFLSQLERRSGHAMEWAGDERCGGRVRVLDGGTREADGDIGGRMRTRTALPDGWAFCVCWCWCYLCVCLCLRLCWSESRCQLRMGNGGVEIWGDRGCGCIQSPTPGCLWCFCDTSALFVWTDHNHQEYYGHRRTDYADM